ncbi:MAG TPA: helix-turn-helix transcriptional regulator [Bryobacteraceae bacterium]|nr:helix-turn-helix transcriptional regulator [Bryobacteraceae bacterium]
MSSNQIVDKLHTPEYRAAFVASQINIGIPFQLRALLKTRGKTQEWLAERAGMRQPRISGLLSPGKTRPNIETLRRLAEAFDCGLAVRFVPFSELVSWSESFDPESFTVPGFDDEVPQNEDMKAIADYVQGNSSLASPQGTALQNAIGSGVSTAPMKACQMTDAPALGIHLVPRGKRKHARGRNFKRPAA